MRTLLLTGVLVLLAAGSASAQPPVGRYGRPNYGPGYRGNISPYLNIVRGNNVGINYFLGTRSEEQRRQNAREFRTDINDLFILERTPTEVTTGTTPQPNTMQTFFNNTGGFFPQAGPTIPGGRR